MKSNREFEIAWQGLKPGIHEFQYELNDRFIDNKQPEHDFRQLNAIVKVKFDKKNNFFLLHFDIDGTIIVPCDRCGDEFEMQLWDEFDLMIKLVAEDVVSNEDDGDAVFIPRSQTVLDLSDWIYEFLLLSIPLQKVHPEKADGASGCNSQALGLLKTLEIHEEEHLKNDIWKGLEGLQIKKEKKKKG
ncbi:MAG TPA: DUF177 domain-containing protein [Flavipsychrobacter sp.]|jgi:uncharacterized metal-binding protein YceD (DUF177 family)|nr:DUF177 domain-containing protein [Flavipsychrobacter sp.]